MFEAAGYMGITLYFEALRATKGNTAQGKLTKALKGVSIDTNVGPISFTPEGVGERFRYVCEVAKVEGVYAWKIIKEYGRVIQLEDSVSA